MSVVHSPPEGTAQPSGEADLDDTPISSTTVGECTTPSPFVRAYRSDIVKKQKKNPLQDAMHRDPKTSVGILNHIHSTFQKILIHGSNKSEHER